MGSVVKKSQVSNILTFMEGVAVGTPMTTVDPASARLLIPKSMSSLATSIPNAAVVAAAAAAAARVPSNPTDPASSSDPASNHFQQDSSSGDGSITCKHCDYVSRQRDRMLRHVKTVHLKEKPHVCSLCTSS